MFDFEQPATVFDKERALKKDHCTPGASSTLIAVLLALSRAKRVKPFTAAVGVTGLRGIRSIQAPKGRQIAVERSRSSCMIEGRVFKTLYQTVLVGVTG